MKLFGKNHISPGNNLGWSAILDLKNLWALDAPLFFVLALEVLRPSILLTRFSNPKLYCLTLFEVFLIWLGRIFVITIQKKYFENGFRPVITSTVFLMSVIIVHLGRLNLGEFLPLFFLFTSAFALIYQPIVASVYWRLIPMSTTVVGFVLGYLRPDAVNPVPVTACLLGGASHWFITKFKNADPVVTFVRIYLVTVVALLVSRIIYSS